jgi:uncharacterized membrane protein
MSRRSERASTHEDRTGLVLWAIIALYALARFLQIFPGKVPMLAVVVLHVIPPSVFALIHGAIRYRRRGILAFIAICLVVGNFFENLSILTGFPFGHDYFTGLMGPKLFAIPILLGLAYAGMAYLSWTLSCLILGWIKGPLLGRRVVTLPLVAGSIMVAWDLSQDPVWSTILHAWIWPHGGAYFGVPVSNFLGWYFTVYVMFQLFALYLRDRAIHMEPLPSGYWRLAVLFYGISAAGNILLVMPRTGLTTVSDPTGVQWKVSDITVAGAVVSIFIMGAFAMLAWVKTSNPSGELYPNKRSLLQGAGGRSGISHE